MKSDLIKYKHYLILLLALLIANFLLQPLANYQSELLLSHKASQKQLAKTKELVSNSEKLNTTVKLYQRDVESLEESLFLAESEGQFKLIAQQKVESLILNSNCKSNRFSFKGKSEVSSLVDKWFLEVSLQGDVHCLISLTRAIESNKPKILISAYKYSVRNLDAEVAAEIRATFNFELFHMRGEDI